MLSTKCPLTDAYIAQIQRYAMQNKVNQYRYLFIKTLGDNL